MTRNPYLRQRPARATLKAVRAAIAMQAPLDHVPAEAVKKPRRKLVEDGLDGIGGTDGVQDAEK